jgi:hypothetical protein
LTTQTQTAALAVQTYQHDPEVQDAEAQVRTIADAARELEIVDEQTNAQALEMLAQARKAHKRIEALKKRWLEPLTKQVKLIRDDFAAMAAPAKEADRILAAKTSAYRAEVAEAARREEARLRKLAEKRQERREAKAAERGEDLPPVTLAPPTVAPPAKTVATDSGAKVTYRTTTHFEVVDPALVPDAYKSVDEKKVGAAVRAGIASPDNPIPGVRIWTTEEAVVR